ncbi:HAD-like domain-containing protein [Calycina marina]|uniref:HAD-like domain-containing protein n=1 Tax=Calycina marina TaxID=1763456 RepID=A0A9P8CJL0_9HELO|nr:HAD-like domain-containing protein [Calycina marina]
MRELAQTLEEIEQEVEAGGRLSFRNNYLKNMRPTSMIRVPHKTTDNQLGESIEAVKGHRLSTLFMLDESTVVDPEYFKDDTKGGRLRAKRRQLHFMAWTLPESGGQGDIPIRACLFDVDGLLINTSDLNTYCHDLALERFKAPPLTWDIKAHMQDRPAKIHTHYLHIFNADFFPKAIPLPGASKLLTSLKSTSDPKIHLGLATGSLEARFRVKTHYLQSMFEAIPVEYLVFGGDPATKGNGKPDPFIYLLALDRVLEDGIAGVKAGLAAGMRVIWVPHPGLAKLYSIMGGESTSDNPFAGAGNSE